MTIKAFFACFGLVCLALSAHSHAAGSIEREYGVYVGAGAGMMDVDALDAFEKDVAYKAGELMAGAYWRWLGLEYRIGKSMEDETINVDSDEDGGIPEYAKTAISSYHSYYLRAQLDNEIARVYALFGQTTANTTSTFQDGEISNRSATGNSIGLGAGFYVTPNMNFNLEFRYLLKNTRDGFVMTGVTLDFWF